MTVERLVPGPTRSVKPAPLPSGTVTLRSASAPFALIFGEPNATVGAPSVVRDCARVDGRTLKDAGISAAPLPDDPTGVRLRARHHSACVFMPVTGLQPALTYQLDVDARVVHGGPPRVCVFQETTNRCARFTAVASDAGRLRYQGEIDPTASG